MEYRPPWEQSGEEMIRTSRSRPVSNLHNILNQIASSEWGKTNLSLTLEYADLRIRLL
jgi:hypothetical protein